MEEICCRNMHQCVKTATSAAVFCFKRWLLVLQPLPLMCEWWLMQWSTLRSIRQEKKKSLLSCFCLFCGSKTGSQVKTYWRNCTLKWDAGWIIKEHVNDSSSKHGADRGHILWMSLLRRTVVVELTGTTKRTCMNRSITASNGIFVSLMSHLVWNTGSDADVGSVRLFGGCFLFKQSLNTPCVALKEIYCNEEYNVALHPLLGP